MKVNSITITESGTITAVIDFEPITVRKDHQHYGAMVGAIKEKNWDQFIAFYTGEGKPDVEQEIKKADIPDLEFKDNNVYFKGRVVNNKIVDVIRYYGREGFDTEPLLKFLRKLMDNPSFRSVEQLYAFIERNSLSIDEDGDILFYKVVTSDYKDKHTKTFDNSIGQVISCDRNQVNDDPNAACSYGFHVGGFAYSGPGGEFYRNGDRVVICKVNPADVVSVPHDANAGKCRCCRYEVIGDFKKKLNQGVTTPEGVDDDEYVDIDPDKFGGPQAELDDSVYDTVNDSDYDEDDDDDFYTQEDDEDDDYLDEDDEEEDYPFDDDYEEEDFGDEDDECDCEECSGEEKEDTLEEGDTITFIYKTEKRKVEITRVDPDLINGRLLKGDPSYIFGVSAAFPTYRNFKRAEMTDVQII